MARYVKIKDGDRGYVWDQEKDILYTEGIYGDGVFVRAKINIHQLRKFCPYAEDDGEFDEFPGVIVNDEMLIKEKMGD